jgi:type I restriction enzyme R subunit
VLVVPAQQIGESGANYIDVINWMYETEMAVVISQEQNEIARFEKWDIDIRLHQEKMEKREIDEEFRTS